MSIGFTPNGRQIQTTPNGSIRLPFYGSESNLDVQCLTLGKHSDSKLDPPVEPWSTGIQYLRIEPIRPWELRTKNQGVPHTYHDISVVATLATTQTKARFLVDEVENYSTRGTNRYQVIFNDCA